MKTLMKLSNLLHLLPKETQPDAAKLFKEQGDVAVKRSASSGLVPKLEPGERAVVMNVSTRDMDRDAEIIMPKGLDLSQYLKSPVVLDSHDYSKLPIGKAVWIKADGLWPQGKDRVCPD